MPFIGKFPFIQFIDSFQQEWVLDFVKCFLYIYWDNYMTFFIIIIVNWILFAKIF